MFDVITFGSATNDVFLKIKKEDFKLGRKVLVDDKIESSGGGGTNTACTLSSLGFKTSYCGLVGRDKEGRAIIKDLRKFKVSRVFLQKRDKTAFSLVLSSGRERTIFVFKGSCHFMKKEDIPFQNLKTKWFYIAPLYDKTLLLFKPIISFAKKNKIKLCVNLSKEQLEKGKEKLKPLLKEIDILLLNEGEAKELLGSKNIIKGLASLCPKIVVVTQGHKGSFVISKGSLFNVKPHNVPFLEKTGAGDAYGSGFLAGLLKKNSIEYAIQVASNNAELCIKKVGAKEGLLTNFKNLKTVQISKKKL